MSDRHDVTDDPLEVACPCCATKLTLDRTSGEILSQERTSRSARSWDEALAAGNRQQAEAERAFAQGMERERNADSILEKKFREAMKKAEKSADPPPRIFDLD